MRYYKYIKYYIKSESDDFGANTSYLTINNKGMLEWQEMDGKQVVATAENNEQ